MNSRIFMVIFGLFLITNQPTLGNSPLPPVKLQTTDQYYIILYVETADLEAIDAFIEEMETYTNKVVSAAYNYTTHEFTIVFYESLRNDTIYQILLRYFDDFVEIEGNYPNHK